MSEPTEIATGPKVKNPKRVEAGKRLAAISKQAKEAKRLKQESGKKEANTDYEKLNNTSYLLVGLVVVGVASYFLFGNGKKAEDKEEPEPESKTENPKSAFDD